MPGLIQKSGYIKPGNSGGHYAKYIATREGVELIEAPSPSHDGGGYLEYMAQRPRSHGLFSADGPADLVKTVEEISGHTGPVWTFIWSLRREDAARLGYETSESWRKLLLAHQTELAQAMKISPKNFRWRAAFHDEKHHPHVHAMVWSADPKQGYLTEKGIEKMRSRLANEIFRDELLSFYQKKDLSYQQVRDAAADQGLMPNNPARQVEPPQSSPQGDEHSDRGAAGGLSGRNGPGPDLAGLLLHGTHHRSAAG
ncbi:hypothetical protein SAMN05216343_11675 [Oscillibacter sp. PC13]|uniref:MobP3 family relaxase n=1 Tax=Oscillibacter sp. PC13 TaxID=1855299 RepID=UPI0008E69B7A|nr:MobP3 family relaxase [Oscillibacter sp. PC13]SFP86206.1 hypothetical protein SAMN05216343_11675 [Oscillibacter sp. PC13]